jgi:hypothetical protein
LRHQAFSGFETTGIPFTAVWGSEPGHPWPRAVLAYYEDRLYERSSPPNTAFAGSLLGDLFGIDPLRDEYQEGLCGVAIYPSTEFCLDLPRNVSVHHFSGSWNEGSLPGSYKQTVMSDWHTRQLVRLAGPSAAPSVYSEIRRELGVYAARKSALALVRRATRLALKRGSRSWAWWPSRDEPRHTED